jgi:hypothetical protein
MSQRPSIATSRIFAAGLLTSATAVMSSRLDELLFFLLAGGSLLLALCIATSMWDSAEHAIAAAIRACVLEPLRPFAQRTLAYAKFAARGVVRLVTTPVATPAAPAASASAGARE